MDIVFETLAPVATDSATILDQKKGACWRAIFAAAGGIGGGGGGGGSGFVGQEFDTDSSSPTWDTDADKAVKDTDTA